MLFDRLLTEQSNEKSAHIEELSTEAIVRYMNEEDATVTQAIQQCIPQIARLVDCIVESFESGGRLIYIGAGTSGRLGVLDASECPPTFGVSSEQVVGLIAGGERALRDAIEGVEDSTTSVIEQLEALNLCSKDTVVGISASGRTPYVRAGLVYAKEIGCHTGAISNVNDSQIGQVAEVNIELLTGPEVVTGSTRLKAGTSQKMVLNMLSTVSMIKIGKIYHGYMVDVQPTNEKLMERATRILSAVTSVSKEDAQLLLESADYNLKVAIVAKTHNISMEEAMNLLVRYNMNIVKAMKHKEDL